VRIHECDQGSDEWNDLHMGIPTASMFHRIVQPGGEVRYKKNGEPFKSAAGELAKGRWTYAYELAVERLLKETRRKTTGLYWPERGKLLEFDAVRHYEFVHSCKTCKVGFISTDDGRWGCSPDRLMVDEVGALELKCPSPETHVGYFIDGPGTDYRCQVQGSMAITGFPWWDFMSFHPQLPDALYRFERDEEFIAKLEQGLNQFCAEVDEVVEKIKEAGFVPSAEQIAAGRKSDGWDDILRADSGAWAIG
jgi:hypothetical protein